MITEPSLHDLRVVALRTAATGLAVWSAGLAAVLAMVGELDLAAAVVLGITGVAHAAAVLTAGRGWHVRQPAVLAYVLATIASIGLMLTRAPGPDTSAFPLLLLPVGLGAITLRSSGTAVTTVGAVAAYLLGAGVAGDGVTVGPTTVRVVVLILLGTVLRAITRQLEVALEAAGTAHRVAEARGDRMAVVARSARAIEASDPAGIVRATLAATAELGWGHAALVLASEDGTAVVESRDLPLPADPVTGAVARAMRLGITVRPSPDDDAIRDSGLGTVLVAPVRVAGVPRGALLVGERSSRLPDRTDDEAVALLAAQAGRALEVAGRLERELHRVELLEERGRERDDFVSTIAHELRTPLTAIIGLAETVRRHKERLPAERRDDLLARVEANARALEGIVTSMLDLAKMERGTLELVLEPVDLADTVQRTVRRLEPLLAQHDVQVRQDAQAAHVVGDARLLERVVENLLTNAGRHTPPGTRIVVATRADARDVSLTVADDGPGMTDEEIRRLGERFHRGSGGNAREPSGVGLGLSLVTEVLRLHGTTLEVESAVGVGTVFTVRLPRSVEVELELDVSRLHA